MFNPTAPPTPAPTLHLVKSIATPERAARLERDILNGHCFYVAGTRIDMDSVMESVMADCCVAAELEQLLTNKKMVDLMKNVLNLQEFFQDHMDEAVALLMDGDLE